MVSLSWGQAILDKGYVSVSLSIYLSRRSLALIDDLACIACRGRLIHRRRNYQDSTMPMGAVFRSPRTGHTSRYGTIQHGAKDLEETMLGLFGDNAMELLTVLRTSFGN